MITPRQGVRAFGERRGRRLELQVPERDAGERLLLVLRNSEGILVETDSPISIRAKKRFRWFWEFFGL